LAGGFTSPWRRGRKHVFNYLIDYLDGKLWGYYHLTLGMIGVNMDARALGCNGWEALNNGLQIGACWTVNFASVKWLWEILGDSPL